jgi:hypothetical protein
MNKKIINVFRLFILSIIICNSLNASNIEIKTGWNFVGFDNKQVLDKHDDFSDIDKINIIWKYDNQNKNWELYSPNYVIENKIKDINMTFDTTLDSSNGVWILAKSDFNITENKDHNLSNSDIEIFDGWNLLSAVDNSHISIENNIFNNLLVWIYRDGKWYLKHNLDNFDKIEINQLVKINPNEAFWVYKQKSITEENNISQDTNSSIDIIDNNSTNNEVNNTVILVPELFDMSFVLDENQTIGTVVSDVNVSTNGGAEILSFSIEGNDSQYFTIDNNGTIITNFIFDYESNKTLYSFSINATNIKGTSSSKIVNIYINDIDDINTTLSWQAIPVQSDNITYNEAIEYCNNLTLGGFTTWKVPSLYELLDESFENNSDTNYWVQYTNSMYDTNLSAHISSDGEEFSIVDKNESHPVKCVIQSISVSQPPIVPQ